MTGKIIRLNDTNVRCPLCHDFFQKRYDETRHQFILACDKDRVAIAAGDPFIGRWDMAHAKAGKIACPVCGDDSLTRFFATSTGFVKTKCMKKSCGATLSNALPDRDKTPGAAPEATPEDPVRLQ